MDRNSFSYVWLVTCALNSFIHLSWMLFEGKFTFSYIGVIFIILYGLQAFSEYKPTPVEDLQEFELEQRPMYGTTSQANQVNPRTSATSFHSAQENVTYVQYRQFSPSRHHHLSSHRFQVDSTQPNCMDNKPWSSDSEPSVEFKILEFCVFLLSTSFFTTDLFFAYQIFSPDLNYIPLLGGLLNIIPALYNGNASHIRDLFLFTIPANCWGQVYYAGFKQGNVFAILAGYLFFVAYYYNDIQRVFKGMTPQAQANYYMGAYCVFASLALRKAFGKFDAKLVK